MKKEPLTQAQDRTRRVNASGFVSSYRSASKLIMLLLWIALVGGYLFYLWLNDITYIEALTQITELLASPYGPLLYFGLFVLRSLVFFSAGILSIVGGVIFGSGPNGNFLLAFIYVLCGTVLSGVLSFWLAQFFGSGFVAVMLDQGPGAQRWSSYIERLRRNGFWAVLLMRLLLLPFDPINYLAGFTRVDWRAFTMATILGVVPTVFAFTSFGAAIDMQALLAGKMPQLDWQMLALALLILGISFLASRLVLRSE